MITRLSGRNTSTNHDCFNHLGGRGGGGGKLTHRIYTKLKGETVGISRHVFQCHSEQRKWGQFEETIGELKTFASTKYVLYIDYLTSIFVNRTQPILIKPTLSRKKETLVLENKEARTIESSTQEEIEEFRIKLKEFLKDEKAIKTIKRSLHNMVWGQCPPMTRTKLTEKENFESVELSSNVLELLKMVQGTCDKMTTNASLYDAINESKRRYHTYHQEPWDDIETHVKAFKGNMEVVEHYEGSLFNN